MITIISINIDKVSGFPDIVLIVYSLQIGGEGECWKLMLNIVFFNNYLHSLSSSFTKLLPLSSPFLNSPCCCIFLYQGTLPLDSPCFDPPWSLNLTCLGRTLNFNLSWSGKIDTTGWISYGLLNPKLQAYDIKKPFPYMNKILPRTHPCVARTEPLLQNSSRSWTYLEITAINVRSIKENIYKFKVRE